MPKYSIITITFNSEKTVERTLKSVLAQEIKDYEYIIVDGASKDSTMEIVKRYEPLFEGRMHWISEPDTGIYNAMNKGIAMAKGDVIGIVNSDDWLESDCLYKVDSCISANNIDVKSVFIVTGAMKFHYSDGSYKTIRRNFETFERYAKIFRMGVNHPATFVSMKAYDTIGTFDEEIVISADADLLARYYEANLPIYFTDEILSNMMDGGLSNQNSKLALKNNKAMLKKHCKTKSRYYWLLSTRTIRDYIKKLPNSWLKIFRKFYR